MDETIRVILSGFPSFAGLVIAILILHNRLIAADKRNDRLIEALIKGENCEENPPDKS